MGPDPAPRSKRRPLSTPDAGTPVGTSLELEIGPVAHGGSCVARHDGRVVFVRHCLPGEAVRAVVTEDRGSYLRADAVDIRRASPHRVRPPCPHAAPGRCGGCDWQHATPEAQRELKATVVREQFTRLAGLDLPDDFAVAELPGGSLGWRTRITFAVDPDGRLGLHRYRSHDIETVDACPLGVPGVGDAQVLGERWEGRTGIEVISSAAGRTVSEHRPGPGRHARGRRPPDRVQVVDGPERLHYRVADRDFAVAATGFWQVHPAAADRFTAAVMAAARPRPGDTAVDLYAGAGLFTAALADAVGTTGRVVAVESNPTAVADAIANVKPWPWVDVRRGRVDAPLIDQLVGELGDGPDVVVLDPPRAGAGAAVMRALAASGARTLVYVACDPAALARDVATARECGWRLGPVEAFDAFPMTHHVECVATLMPPTGAF